MLERILIVCIGNICRSPSAQALMSEALSHDKRTVRIDSAGLAARVGLPMEPTARAVLLEHRHRPPTHRACQLERSMLQQADLVLVMERQHLDSIYRIAPEARGKTFLLGKWQDEAEIQDPFRRDRTAFEQAYRQIRTAVEAWTVRLSH
ncbi:Low molecular weight phosphotyrosine protein phosphatase [Azotobacter vinelandii CA]|uniref:protein-tyrosine-phosphatase n=2 Tax=Azotobacter vinelandii TaxID=354 RepID=C1DM68_AZOVD|nr:low molecular weight protein-tyrosine-phosphatase [Azotobacter vinelandii]ACO79155.1 Low molecular weight phosphotyrosine protein phosphatase [Azotobacter vinelandii DJ]AGK14793.1 Low molecular weight phosphotyrosine protein phosphatase [Azotobacter vinelandii CA]AGK21007.1 Low molecular weight phosphotyrosine protein phosphatase [Azotobacter vinelandii CA6]WKN20129.1 low molecular weight phosphotyrosine protein phosphatase [Azotobacter vinelandii]GLK58335.1 low molecular weight phosphotyro